MTDNKKKNSSAKIKRGEELYQSFGFGNKKYQTSDIAQIKDRLKKISKNSKSTVEKNISKEKFSNEEELEEIFEKNHYINKSYKDQTLKNFQKKTNPDYELQNIFYSNTPFIVEKYNIKTNPRATMALRSLSIKNYYKNKSNKCDFPYKRLALGVFLSLGIVGIVNKISNK